MYITAFSAIVLRFQLLLLLFFSPASISLNNILCAKHSVCQRCCGSIIKNRTSLTILDCLYQYQLDNNNASATYDVMQLHEYMLITYSTVNIQQYSLFSYGVNAAFAEMHNYSILATSPSTGHMFDLNDQRWNKVAIIAEIVQSHEFDGRYVVWLDADLIVTRLEFSLQSITTAHPWADLIICADSNRENGLVNTGSMIVKRSSWSAAFFHHWWTAFDRSAGMDQHAFDLLWARDALSVRSGRHVAILESGAFNSRFPAHLHHHDNNPVLHLAGASSWIRSVAFQRAFDNLCIVPSSSSSPSPSSSTSSLHPLQLGLDAAYLHKLFVEQSASILRAQCEHILQQLLQALSDDQLVDPNPDLRLTQLLDRVENWKSQLRDLAQSVTTSRSSSIQHGAVDESGHFAECHRRSLRALLESLCNLTALKGAPDLNVTATQVLLDTAFELAVAEEQPDLIRAPIHRALPYLDALLSHPLPSSSLRVLLYYKMKALEFLLDLTSDTVGEQLLEMYEVWRRMSSLGYFGTGNGLSEPFLEVAHLLRRIAAVWANQGRLAEAASALSEGLFLLQDPWLHRERGVEERLQLWKTYFIRSCRNEGSSSCNSSSSSSRGDEEKVFFIQHFNSAMIFEWSEAPRTTAVSIVTMQAALLLLLRNDPTRGSGELASLEQRIGSQISRTCCTLLKTLRNRPDIELGGDHLWVLADEPLLRADPDSIRFGPFSGAITTACGCERAVSANEVIQKKKSTIKRYFKRTT